MLWPILEKTKVAYNLQDYVEQNRIGQASIVNNQYLYIYLKEVIEDPWDLYLPLTPKRKVSMDLVKKQRQQKEWKRFQSIYEELDA